MSKVTELYAQLDLNNVKLAHHGIRGMKWGVRKDLVGVRNLINRNDHGVLAKTGTTPTKGEIRKISAHTDRIERVLRDPNGDFFKPGGPVAQLQNKYAGKDLSKDSAARAAYYRDLSAEGTAVAQKHAPAGTDARVVHHGNGNFDLMVGPKENLDELTREIKHAEADSSVDVVSLRPILNELGFITGFEKNEDALGHISMNAIEDFLEHHGIRGMKWGIRRSDRQLASTKTVATESVDAERAKNTLSTIRAKGSLSAVSDADLNHLINRINTEKKFKDIETFDKKFKKRNEQVKLLLDAGETMNNALKFYHSPAGHILASKIGLPKPSGFGKHASGAVAGRHAK